MFPRGTDKWGLSKRPFQNQDIRMYTWNDVKESAALVILGDLSHLLYLNQQAEPLVHWEASKPSKSFESKGN